MAQNKILYESLEAVEWIDGQPFYDGEYVTFCPECLNEKKDGHTPECKLNIALRAARGDVVSHLAAGDDTICTKCGWIGMEDESFEEMPSGTGLSLLRPWVCPKCGGSVEVGADEVCKIALAALSPEPWGGTEGEEE